MNHVISRMFRHRRARVGASLVGLLFAGAALAPVIAPYDPIAQLDLISGQHLPPSLHHPFGTDQLSRDLLSRVLYGARISLTIGTLSMLVSITVGTLVGVVAGWAGRAVDALLMRAVDAGLAIPRIFLLLIVLALWTNLGIVPLIAILGLTSWFDTSRIVRAEVLSVKTRDYMAAARALGIRRARLLARHVLPNVASPIIVTATLGIGQIILIEAGLSFLGVGIPKPTPSWGTMIADGQRYLTVAPWSVAFPGIAIVVTVVAFSLLGDGLRDALDPRTR